MIDPAGFIPAALGFDRFPGRPHNLMGELIYPTNVSNNMHQL
jgi:hypothetical protein